MIPHVVRAEEVDPENIQQIDTGTTNNIELRPINSPQQLAAGDAGASTNPSPAGFWRTAGCSGTSTAGADADAGHRSHGGPAGHEPTLQQQASAAAPVNLQLTPPQSTQKVGSSFKMIVNLSGGSDVFAVPMDVQYDASKLTLINVDTDDPQNPNVLGKERTAVALAHRDDGKGNAAVAASRPPGTKGVTGSGRAVRAHLPGESPRRRVGCHCETGCPQQPSSSRSPRWDLRRSCTFSERLSKW